MRIDDPQISGSTSARDAARDWQAVHDLKDIQYAPLPPLKPPETPDWLKAFGEWLNELFEGIFGPLGKMLGLSGQVIIWLLISLTALLVLYLLWRLLEPVIAGYRRRERSEEPEWAPDRSAAVALLEEADRLAAEGRYGEATHLLLQRSVRHIADARPDWLIPASTAREIASLPMLPARAREAFAVIAVRVERSLFALRDLNRQDWDAARAAYADFALAGLAS